MLEKLHQRELRLFLGAVFILLLGIFAMSLGNNFVNWDDPLLIIDNPISHGLTLTNIINAFTHFDPDLYVPVTFLSFQINYVIGGVSPFIYHLTNLLLHFGSALLVGWIILQFSNKKWVAAIVALLFVAHPINVEAVAWASARKDVLSSFFFLLSLGLFLRWKDVHKRSFYIGSLVAFAIGLLAKVSILGLPLILLLIEFTRTGRITKVALKESIPFFLLSAVLGFVALFGKMGGTLPLVGAGLLGTEAVWLSLWHVLLPIRLSILYPYDVFAWGNWDLWLSFAAVIAVSIGVVITRKKYPTVLFAWFWFALLLAPSFLTVEKGKDLVPDLYLTSDRYVYLAAIGIFYLVARGADLLRRKQSRVIDVAVIVLILALSALSFSRTFVWENSETLLKDAIAKNPESSIAHNNLGVYYRSIGKDDLAAREYAVAVRGKATSDAWFNYGITQLQLKNVQEAAQAFANAVGLRPDHALAQLNLGALLLDAGEVQMAIDRFLAAQKADPGNITVYLNLGMALEKGGNIIDAKRAYQRALQLDPQNAYATERLKKLGS